MNTTILIIALIQLNFNSVTTDCEIKFHQSFYNFVTYNDTVGYSLEYNFKKEPPCLKDTIDFIHFLLSDRYTLANSDAIKLDSNSLSMHPLSYFAYNTSHKKVEQTKRTSSAFGPYMNMVSVEVLQLYFISALYYNDFQFKNKITLASGNKIVMSTSDLNHSQEIGESRMVETVNKKVIKKARKSFLKWLEIVDNHGLNYVRKHQINPLSFAKDIEWKNE